MQLGIILYRAVRVSAALGALALVSLKIASTCRSESAPRSTSPTTSPALTPAQRTGAPDEVIDIAVGSQHACALRADGRVACWGDVGLKPKLVEHVFDAVRIAAAGGATCVLTKTDQVQCWGSRYSDNAHHPISIILGLSEDPIDLVLGDNNWGNRGEFGCVLHARGRVSCWNHLPRPSEPTEHTTGRLTGPKYQSAAQLVDGVTSAQSLIAAGHIACARTSESAATCWGDHNTYEVPSDTPTLVPNFLQIHHPPFAAALSTTLDASTITRCENGQCWGVDLSRRTAIATGKAQWVDTANPRPMFYPDACWIDHSAEAHCKAQKLDGVNAQKIAVSKDRGCAIRTNGKVACWGGWRHTVVVPIRQPSMSVVTHTIKNESFCAVRKNGTVKCSGKPFHETYDRAEVPYDLSPATMVSVGHNQACIVTTASKVECWGGGDTARHDGLDDDATREVPNLTDVQRVEVGDASACAETKSGDVYCWGDADEFEAAPPQGSTSIVDIQLP
jgi:hypothetical protein